MIGTLLVSCADRQGIVATIAQALYSCGVNILDADQHTDPVAGQFFQRIRFDTAHMGTDLNSLEKTLRRVVDEFDMQWSLAYDGQRTRVALFASRREHCLYDLLVRHRFGDIDCDIPLIVSNHLDLEPVAEQFGIPFVHVPKTASSRLEQERRELEALRRERVDLVVLARYMQILSPAFVDAFPARIINIHHSFLPAFAGPRPYRRAYERGVKLIGATAHYVTRDLDEGPIIEQDVVRCSHRDGVRDLARKGRDLENVVLARAVRLHLERRVLPYGNKTVVFA